MTKFNEKDLECYIKREEKLKYQGLSQSIVCELDKTSIVYGFKNRSEKCKENTKKLYKNPGREDDVLKFLKYGRLEEISKR